MRQNYIVRGAAFTLGGVLVLLGCALLWNIREVIFLVFISLLLGAGIEPVVNWLRKGPFNRGIAILLVYTLIFTAISLVLYLSMPPLVREVRSLIEDFSSEQSINQAISNIDNDFLQQAATAVYQSAGDLANNFGSRAVNLSLSVFGGFFAVLTVFVITYYWLTEREKTRGFILSFFPRANRGKAQEVWRSVDEKLGAWVRGQLVMMLFIGVLSGIGYTVMGLRFAFALAVFAGLTELIPLVGPYLGGSAAVLVALTQSVTLALVVVIFIVVLQFIEGNVLVPRVMEKAVGVNPLAVILGITIGATLAGIPGALIAVPVVAMLQVFYNHLIRGGGNQNTSSRVEAEQPGKISPAGTPPGNPAT